jgi:hypothetical protein
MQPVECILVDRKQSARAEEEEELATILWKALRKSRHVPLRSVLKYVVVRDQRPPLSHENSGLMILKYQIQGKFEREEKR